MAGSGPSVQAQIRWAANVDDLKKNIAEGIGVVDAMKTSVDRTVQSLSGNGLFQAANRAAAAITELGDVTKLSGAEQDRYNTLMMNAIEKANAMGREVPQAWKDIAAATQQAEEPTSKISSTFDELGDHIKSTMLGFVSAQAIIGAVEGAWEALTGFVKDSIQVYAQAEAAERRLTVAVQTQGDAIPDLADQYMALGRQFQQTTTYSHTTIEAAEALFIQLGNVGPSMMNRALQAATDLSSGLGIDLNTAVTMLSKAFEGHTTALGRYGIVLDQARVQSEGMTYVLDAIESKVGGQAQAELDTYAGRVKQLGNAWDDVKEKVGGFIATDPVFRAGLEQATEAANGTAKSGNVFSAAWDAVQATMPDWLRALKDLHDDLLDDADAANAGADAVRKMASIPPPKMFQGTDIKTQFADWDRAAKEFADNIDAGWKKDDEAAKKYAASVDAAMQKWSGGAATEQMKILDTVFRRLADSGKITQDQVAAIAAEAVKLQGEGAKLTDRLAPIVLQLGLLNPKVKDGITDFKDLGETIKTITIPAAVLINEQIDDFQKKIHDGFGGIGEIGLKVGDGFKQGAKDIEDAVKRDNAAFKDMIATVQLLGREASGGLADFLNGIGKISQMLELAKKSEEGFHTQVGVASGLLSDNATTSEKWSSAVSSATAIASGAQNVWNATANAGSKSAGAFKGAVSGAEAGAAFGPWGAAVGAAAGAIVGFIRNATAGRKAVEDFANSMGGFDTLHAKLDALGASGEQMWIKLTQGTAKGDPAAAKAEIDTITAALDAQQKVVDGENSDLTTLLGQLQGLGAGDQMQAYLDKLSDAKNLTADNLAAMKALAGDTVPSFDEMTKAASALGVSTDALGQSFHDAKAKADWQSVIDNLDTLQRGGANMNDLLGDKGLQQKISDLVNQSVKFGTEIPANAKPWIESLAKQGLLLDENGNKITDTSKLKFGGDLATSLQTLIDKIGTLIDKLSTGVPDAINKIPKDVKVNVDLNATRSGDWTDSGGDASTAATGGYVGKNNIIPFPMASGGGVPSFKSIGTDTVPAMLTPGEIVLNAAQQGRVAGAIGGGGSSRQLEQLQGELAGLRRDLREQADQAAAERLYNQRMLPKLVAAAAQRKVA